MELQTGYMKVSWTKNVCLLKQMRGSCTNPTAQICSFQKMLYKVGFDSLPSHFLARLPLYLFVFCTDWFFFFWQRAIFSEKE